MQTPVLCFVLLVALATASMPPAPSPTKNCLVTGYGYNDNSPPSAQIAYPVKHKLATEGSGTYNDPITFASVKSEFAPGTIVYLPFVQKYIIMEDLCGQCQKDWANGKCHIDLWMGPQKSVNARSLNACEDKLTHPNTPIYVNPPQNFPVDTTPLFTSSGQCTAVFHPTNVEPTGDGSGDGSNPSGDGSNPSGDGSNPSGDGSNPSGDGSNPSGDGYNSYGDGSKPSGDGSNSYGDGSNNNNYGSSGSNNNNYGGSGSNNNNYSQSYGSGY